MDEYIMIIWERIVILLEYIKMTLKKRPTIMKNCKYQILIFLFSVLNLVSFSQTTNQQYCSPIESWLPLPGDPFLLAGSGEEFTIMNGKLYMLYFDSSDQFYKISSWDGSVWTEETNVPMRYVPYGFTNYKNELYVGGGFSETSTGIPGGNAIIRWDGNQWKSLGTGLIDTTRGTASNRNMYEYQGELYVGGNFNQAGNIYSQGIAKWNGSNWSEVGGGLSPGPRVNFATALEFIEYQGKLIVAGEFYKVGTDTATNIVAWDGTNWESLGPKTGTGRQITSMEIFQGDLIVYGGAVAVFGGKQIRQLARWDGTDWYDMGFSSNQFTDIRDLQVYNGELYAAGARTDLFPNLSTYRINVMKYTGTGWVPVASPNSNVRELVVFQDRLYAIGAFNQYCNISTAAVARFCGQANCGIISGNVFKDDNGNCEQNIGEIALESRSVKIDPINTWIPTDSAGTYRVVLDTGTYTIQIPEQRYYERNCDTIKTVSISQGSSIDTLDFALDPIQGIEDLRISLTTGFARPGFVVPMYITYKNVGIEPMNGFVTLSHDSVLTFDSTNVQFASYMDSTITWGFSNLQVDETRNLIAWFTLDVDSSLLGDTLLTSAAILPIVGDEDSTNNREDIIQIIRGSFDPNDKSADPPEGDVAFGTSSFTYTVRFQNTGTDTAFKVIIKDTLSQKLSFESFEMLSSSHPYYIEVEDGYTAKWVFEDILLPDSNINEAASHGFVKYRISTASILEIGDSLNNRAAIYFDFNAPVITNTVSHYIVEQQSTSIQAVDWIPLQVFPNPVHTMVTFEASEAWKRASLTLIDLRGKVVKQVVAGQGNRIQVSRGTLVPGVYIYKFSTSNGKQAFGKIVFE